MNASYLVSVIIPTYNRSDALLAVLDGLARQTDHNFEVIVADDGSRPEHQRTILESSVARSLRIVYLWHPDVGFTLNTVRNRGMAVSRGKYIVLLDGDCVPDVDFIAQHRALAEPGFFVNGSRVLLSDKFTQRVVTGTECISGRAPSYWVMQRILGHVNKLSGTLRLPHWVRRNNRGVVWKGIRGCNMGFWRTDFESIDGFDESFVGWGHEDADFVLRLHNTGVLRKNGFCATEVFHLWHKEAARDRASENAKIVMARAKTSVTRPTLGFSHKRNADDAVITRLG